MFFRTAAPDIPFLLVVPRFHRRIHIHFFRIPFIPFRSLVIFLHPLAHGNRRIVPYQKRRDQDQQFPVVPGSGGMPEELADNGDIPQQRNLGNGLAVLGIQQPSDGHGHTGADVDHGFRFPGSNGRDGKIVFLHAVAVIQGGHLRMDLGGDLVVRIHHRLDVQFHPVIPPVNGNLPVPGGGGDGDPAPDQDLGLLAAHGGNGRPGQDPGLAAGYQGLERGVQVG